MTLILQNDESDCLLACYAMVLDSLGAKVNIDDLQDYRKDPRRGMALSELKEANRDFGVAMSAVRIEDPKKLEKSKKHLDSPLIAHLKNGHFVVVTAIRKKSVLINDPAFGPVDMSTEEFSEVSSGVLISFSRRDNFKEIDLRPKPLEVIKSLSLQAKLLLVVAVLFAQVSTLGVSILSKSILDGSIDGTYTLLSLVLSLVAIVVVTAEIQRRASHSGVDDFEDGISHDLFSSLAYKNVNWVKSRGTGRVVEILSLRNQIRDILLRDLGPTVVSSLTLLPLFAYMAYLNIWMAILMASGFTLYLWLLLRLSLRRFYQFQGYVFGQVQISALVAGDLDRWKEIQIRREQKQTTELWTRQSGEVSGSYKRCLNIDRNINILGKLFTIGSSLIVVSFGAFSIREGTMSIGDLVIVQLLTGLLSASASTIQSGMMSVRNMGTFFYSLLDILSSRKRDTNDESTTSNTQLTEHLIECRGVEVIRNSTSIVGPVDLTLEQGEILEIKGPSGVGKTTLIDAILGVVPSDGDILYNKELDFNNVGIASPDLHYQPGNLREFIDPKGALSEGKICEVLRSVCLESVISLSELRHAPSAFVNSLSSGQFQRLILARSLVLGTQLVVWDEPFGTLDETTAREVIDRVMNENVFRDRAFLLVTHQSFANLKCDKTVELG